MSVPDLYQWLLCRLLGAASIPVEDHSLAGRALNWALIRLVLRRVVILGLHATDV